MRDFLVISTGVLFLQPAAALRTLVSSRHEPWFSGQAREAIATVCGENLGPGTKRAAGVVLKENAWPIVRRNRPEHPQGPRVRCEPTGRVMSEPERAQLFQAPLGQRHETIFVSFAPDAQEHPLRIDVGNPQEQTFTES